MTTETNGDDNRKELAEVYGIDFAKLTNAQQLELIEQELVLTLLQNNLGDLRKVCAESGIPKTKINKWIRLNTLNFTERRKSAIETFANELTSLGFDRLKNPTKGIGGDSLLIAYLQAFNPERFKPSVNVDASTAKELLKEIKTAAVSEVITEQNPATINEQLDEILTTKKLPN